MDWIDEISNIYRYILEFVFSILYSKNIDIVIIYFCEIWKVFFLHWSNFLVQNKHKKMMIISASWPPRCLVIVSTNPNSFSSDVLDVKSSASFGFIIKDNECFHREKHRFDGAFGCSFFLFFKLLQEFEDFNAFQEILNIIFQKCPDFINYSCRCKTQISMFNLLWMEIVYILY